jgi:hypothetical protein
MLSLAKRTADLNYTDPDYNTCSIALYSITNLIIPTLFESKSVKLSLRATFFDLLAKRYIGTTWKSQADFDIDFVNNQYGNCNFDDPIVSFKAFINLRVCISMALIGITWLWF